MPPITDNEALLLSSLTIPGVVTLILGLSTLHVCFYFDFVGAQIAVEWQKRRKCKGQGEKRGGGGQAEGSGHEGQAARGSSAPQDPYAQEDDHQEGETEAKHKKLLKRFAEARKKRKEEHKNREKTKVVGDLKPLRDALPSLQDIYKLVKTKQKDVSEGAALTEPEVRLSANEKIRKKRTEMVNTVKSFEKLIKDKNFKKNPREVIAAHVRNKYQAMEEDDYE